MSADKIARMANQIAKFMENKPREDVLTSISAPLNDFLDPRMRSQRFALLDNGGAGLRPLVIEAAGRIRRPQAA